MARTAPFGSHTPSERSTTGEVSDARVYAACKAYFDALPSHGGEAANFNAMRAALEAAALPVAAPMGGDAVASSFDKFSSENVARMLANWAADQRERRAWRDRDEATYNYCAELLQTAVNRIAATPAPSSGEADRLRADAARYAWLRSEANQDEHDFYALIDGLIPSYLAGDELDAAIDAARIDTPAEDGK